MWKKGSIRTIIKDVLAFLRTVRQFHALLPVTGYRLLSSEVGIWDLGFSENPPFAFFDSREKFFSFSEIL